MARSGDIRSTFVAVTDQAQSHGVGEPRGSQALSESLELQRAARERLTAGKPKHGKRRKGRIFAVWLQGKR